MHPIAPQALAIPLAQPSFFKKSFDFLHQKVFRVAFAIFSWIGNKVYRLFKGPSPAAPPTVDPRVPPAANLAQAEQGFYTGNALSRRIIDHRNQKTRYFWVMDLLNEGLLHARFNENGTTVFDSNFEVCGDRYRLFRERMGQMVQGFDDQTKIKLYDFSSREYLIDGLFKLNQSFQERWMILPSWQVETLEFSTSATQLIARRTLTEVPVYERRLKQNVYYTMIVTRTLSPNQDTQEFSFQLNPRLAQNL
jgi:hypothetical protein